jgi:hypothetical protein
MATHALRAPLPAVLPAKSRWIESPAFDLGFFVLSPILTLPIVFASMFQVRLLPALGFLLAFAHYLSTVAFFFWQENRPHHRQRWLAFFGGPALITLTFCLLLVFRVPLVIQVVIFFWNVFHVARQSNGIMSIYRHANGATDQDGRVIAGQAILSANLWFSLWNIESHAEVMPVLGFVSPRLASLLFVASGVLAAFCFARLLLSLAARVRAGAPPRLPELLILATGFTLFHPFLWLADSGGATFAMLLPHYVQYLGIVWLVHRRRFSGAKGSGEGGLLPSLSRSTPFLVLVLLCVTVGLLFAKKAATVVGAAHHFEAFYLLVALVHFYLDGLFWAFKNPHVRTTLGPWLVRREA